MSLSFNDFKTKLRTYVLASSSVTNLIGQRFIGAQLATLYNISGSSDWPKACFWADSGVERHWGILQQFPLNIWAYSNISHDEAHTILTAIYDRVNKQSIESLIRIRAIGTPTEKYEEEPRLYSTGQRFQVHRLQAD